jgi:predicted RNase H-like HicB family nuclease
LKATRLSDFFPRLPDYSSAVDPLPVTIYRYDLFKRGLSVDYAAVLLPAPEGGFTALNPETGSTTQGETVEEAIANLREATELFVEEFPRAASGRPLVTTFELSAHA